MLRPSRVWKQLRCLCSDRLSVWPVSGSRLRTGRRAVPLIVEALECRVLLSNAGALELMAYPQLPALGRRDADADLGVGNRDDAPEWHPSQILVRFKEGAVADGKIPPLVAGTELGEKVGSVPGLFLVELSGGVTVEAAVAAYQESDFVARAQPDFIYTVQGHVIPSDDFFSEQWALHNIGQQVPSGGTTGTTGTVEADIDGAEAWNVATSSTFVVAVIDTGIDYAHPDLQNNIWINPDETPGNGEDEDLNNLDDDIRGWDFVNNDNDPMDDHWHGTHMAGIIGAVGNNDEGLAGVAWDIELMPLKAFRADGTGVSSAIAAAIDYAINKKVRIINASWGLKGEDPEIFAAVQRFSESGGIFVAAAGNDGTNNDDPGTPVYPANWGFDNIIAVAASDQDDMRGEFPGGGSSNWGQVNVDIAAPGTNIFSTIPSHLYSTPYGYGFGTSQAAPHVAGVVALVWSQNPTWTYQQVIDQVLDTADFVPNLLLDNTPVAEGRRLNASRALSLYDADPTYILTGPGAGAGTQTRFWEGDLQPGGTIVPTITERVFPYSETGFTGGVRVASGDVNGDGVPDLVTSPGSGMAPEVRVYDGATGQQLNAILAYTSTFTGGVFVGVGDFTGDGRVEVVTAPDAEGGPKVRIFDALTGVQLGEFLAYGEAFRGGVRVAAADVNGDGIAEVITTPGPGGGPVVRVFDGVTFAMLNEFRAYVDTFTGGLFVAAGDFNQDGLAEVVTAPDATGGPKVRIFNAMTDQQLGEFFAYGEAFKGGVRVAAADMNGDGIADVVTAPGAGGGPVVRVFDGSTFAMFGEYRAFVDGFTGGVYVAANTTPLGTGSAFQQSIAQGTELTSASSVGDDSEPISPTEDDAIANTVGTLLSIPAETDAWQAARARKPVADLPELQLPSALRRPSVLRGLDDLFADESLAESLLAGAV